jgi:translation elongation factor EF-Ts
VLADIALHIVATQPIATRRARDEVPADVSGPAIARIDEEVSAMGKPPEITERIRESKLKLFYAEQNVLGDQPFINADKFQGTIDEYARKSGASVTGFARLEVGAAE